MAKVVVDGRVLNHSHISGVERYVGEICRTLLDIESRHRIVIATPPFGGRILSHFWEHICLPLVCLKENADLLFCPANIAPLVRSSRIRLVVTIHGLAFRYYPQAYTKGFDYYYSYLIPRVLRSADAILAVSKAEKESILDQYGGLDPKKIYPIHNGINHDIFNLDRKNGAKQLLRQRYGIRGKFILAVGSLTVVKNMGRLVDAFLRIADGTDAKLVLVCGVGPYRYEMGAEIKDPRLTIVRNVDRDLTRFYQAAELTVLPSRYEGFGFPALEAMACGCPVVVSNVAALPEICADAALYVDPNDTQNVADAMRRILTDDSLRQHLVDRGLDRVKQFTWQKTVAETIAVFDDVLGKP